MPLTVKKTSDYSIAMEKDGENYAGFLTTTTAKSRTCGWIATADTLEPWEISGIMEFEKRKYIYGPDFKGEFLERKLSSLSAEELLFLAKCLKQLPEEYETKGIHSYSIIFGKEKILILPPESVESFLRLRPLEDRLAFFDIYNYPDKINHVYSLGVLLYRILTGQKPFPLDDRSELIHRQTTGKIIGPKLIRHTLKHEVDEYVLKILANSATDTIQDFIHTLEGWISDGFDDDLSEPELAERRKKQQALEKSLDRSVKAKKFLRKKWPILAISGTGFVALLWILITAIGNLTDEPYTLGMTPEEVVQNFYQSINTLDQEAMDGSVIGNAGKKEINSVMNMFVITRTRMAYEGDSAFLNAQEWKDSNYTTSRMGITVWGIADLNITKTDDLEFEVTYERWGTESEMEDVNAPLDIIYTGYREKASVVLEERVFKYAREKPVYYLISAIEYLGQTELETIHPGW